MRSWRFISPRPRSEFWYRGARHNRRPRRSENKKALRVRVVFDPIYLKLNNVKPRKNVKFKIVGVYLFIYSIYFQILYFFFNRGIDRFTKQCTFGRDLFLCFCDLCFQNKITLLIVRTKPE